jgi:hypothetical protein
VRYTSAHIVYGVHCIIDVVSKRKPATGAQVCSKKFTKCFPENFVFGEINKIYKLLARLTVIKREKTEITSVRNETGNITADLHIKKLIREYYKQLYTQKLNHLEKI